MERIEFTAIRIVICLFKQATFLLLPKQVISINEVDKEKVGEI